MNDMDEEMTKRAEELCRMTNAYLRGRTPYECECALRVFYADARKEPVDPVAKKVMDDSPDCFNAEWRRRREEGIES